jgi:hypothetical protein
MKRFVLVLAALGTFGLIMSGCNKEEKAADKPADEAAKPAEGDTAAAKPDEAKPDEAKPDEAKPDEAAAAGDTPSVGIEACDAIIKRYMACEKMPAQAKQAFKGVAGAWKQSVEKGGEEAKAPVTKACEDAAKAQDEGLKAAGC